MPSYKESCILGVRARKRDVCCRQQKLQEWSCLSALKAQIPNTDLHKDSVFVLLGYGFYFSSLLSLTISLYSSVSGNVHPVPFYVHILKKF